MYFFDSRVRYSETDEEGKLGIPGIVDYFQDVSTFQSEDLGLGVEYLKGLGLVWVMSAWQIVIHSYPRLGDRIRVGTFPYEFKGFMGLRNFFLDGEDGQRMAVLLRTEEEPRRLNCYDRRETWRIFLFS